MLRISRLTLARGTKRLLEGASLYVHAGHKVGIVGANGSGKSSLFAAIRGELTPDAGDIDVPPRWIVAHVAQETPVVSTAAMEFVQDGDRELRDVERALLQPGLDGAALAELHHRYDEIGGYAARARAATLLAGLGFSEAQQALPVDTFSGGWRMRLNLAQALMCRSDLLLLDEPTNHLDLDAVLWLEDWLRRYPGTLLLITHDRDFLDAIVDTIVHVDAGTLKTYSGNYSQFERQRAADLALQQASYAKQQRQIIHLRAFVDRFRAKATKARQAQSRIKALERMELIAPAHVDSPFSFEFLPVERSARQLVRLEHVTLGYSEDAPVLRDIDWAVLSGARIGLLGANGAGKSTLMKALGGTLPPIHGQRLTAQQLRIGYFAQHQVEALRLEESPLWHLARLEPDAREQDLRDFLGGFDIRGDMATSPVAPLSGGEKARLTLALIVRQRPNLLLLDEPTNHLDIEMREALTEALQDYDGALIVVAHDRHLLRATVDELWLVHDGRVDPFDGDLDDYRAWVLSGQARATSATDEVALDKQAPRAADRRAQKRQEAEARQRRSDARKPLVARQTTLESDLARLMEEKRALDEWLAGSEAYSEPMKTRLVTALERQGELAWTLARLESEWLSVEDEIERLRRSEASDA
jgi:ATP-binding cassette subfamily F protein 3